MKMRIPVTFLALAISSFAGVLLADDATPAPAPAPPPPLTPFPDGTRWAAIGDSITHGGWYTQFIRFFYFTRFPKENLTFFDRGCNGDAAWQIPNRYSYDIAAIHPTVATIMLGMNDGGLAFYNPTPTTKWSEPLDVLKQRAIDGYEKSLKALVERLLQDKIPVIVLTPSPYDEIVQSKSPSFMGYNEALTEEAKRAVKVAQEEGVPVVDFNGPMNAINQKYQATDPNFSVVGGFRIHPGPQGHLVMAYEFLKAQHVPSDVARFSIKGSDGTVTSTNNCQIDQVKATNGTVSFTYSANALPFPIDWWTRPALKWIPFTNDLNQEVFQVTDLPAGNYDVQIDGKTVATYTAEELGAGVNLSENEKTPEYQQAFKAWTAYSKLFDTYSKLRDLVCDERTMIDAKIPRPLTLDQMNPILDQKLKDHAGKPDEARVKQQVEQLRALKPKEADLNALIDSTLTQVQAMVQPVPHQVTIAPSTGAPVAK
jgi:lysophospholipase L1-like esterase